jgi:hypothetical protein
VHEPQHAEGRDHECDDARAEGRTDTEGRDQETRRRGSDQVSEVLRGREQGVRALPPHSAGVGRRRHEALPRCRARRVGERAEHRQQQHLPDLERTERQQHRERRDGQPADEVGERARAHRAHRVHDPTGDEAADGRAGSPGEDHRAGDGGTAGGGEHQPRDRDHQQDVARHRHRVDHDQMGHRRGARRGSPARGVAGRLDESHGAGG